MAQAQDVPLTRIERIAMAVGEFANEDRRGKWLQNHFLRGVSYPWVRAALANRMLVDGLDDLMVLRPTTGVLLASNHRSFFDQYAMLLACYMGPVPWSKHLFFPVRSNFFYDQPLGIAVNYAIAAGSMYPPVYRQADRRALNDDALDRMVEIVKQPGNVLGMHPEGTRGKGDDPYTLLPGQPGIGKLALVGKPMVIPAFTLGLGNNVLEDARKNFSPEARSTHAVISVFGPPVDYADLAAEKPRPTLYKKCADRFMAAIKALMPREQALRADILAGRVAPDDPRWLGDRHGVSRLYAHEAQR